MATKTAMAKAEKPAASRELTKAQWKWKEAKQNWVAYVMVAPYMIIFAMFTIVPVFLSIFMSFTDFNMLEMPNMVWMKNYVTLFFDDDIFLIAIKNTFIFAVIVGPSSYLMSFLVAWFINELPPKIRSLVTLVFYAPSISGQVYLIWGTLFSSDSYGWANAWLSKLGFIDEPINWFKDEKYVMPLCIVVSLWMSLGTSFLAFIAGLQGIDSAQYEAGAVDGVRNRWQELYYITGTPPSLYNQIKGDAFAPRNEHALKIDFEQEPPFFPVSETHYAKTWLLDPRAPKLEKPEAIRDLHEKIKKMTDKGGAFHVE